MSDVHEKPGEDGEDFDLEQALLSTSLFSGGMGFAPNGTFQGQLEAMLEELAAPPDESFRLDQLERAIAGEALLDAPEAEAPLEAPAGLLESGSLSILNDLLGFELIPETDKLP